MEEEQYVAKNGKILKNGITYAEFFGYNNYLNAKQVADILNNLKHQYNKPHRLTD